MSGDSESDPGSKERFVSNYTALKWCPTAYYLVQGMSSKFVDSFEINLGRFGLGAICEWIGTMFDLYVWGQYYRFEYIIASEHDIMGLCTPKNTLAATDARYMTRYL